MKHGTARLWRGLVALFVAMTALAGGLLVASGPASAADGQIIFPQGADAHGTYATVQFQLWKPGTAHLEVSKDPLPAGMDSYPSYYQAMKYNLPTGSTFKMNVTKLDAGQKYYYTITGYDPATGTKDVWRNATFTTKHRLVKVDYDSVKVNNDGDVIGCGEVSFGVGGGDTMSGGTPSGFMGAYFPLTTRCDGDVKALSVSSGWQQWDGPSKGRLELNGHAKDDDTVFNLCMAYDCADYAEGSFSPDLGALDGRTNEIYNNKALTLHLGPKYTGNILDLTFTGRISITYTS